MPPCRSRPSTTVRVGSHAGYPAGSVRSPVSDGGRDNATTDGRQYKTPNRSARETRMIRLRSDMPGYFFFFEDSDSEAVSSDFSLSLDFSGVVGAAAPPTWARWTRIVTL